MECPKCGYQLSAFETECPRCARLGDTATPKDAVMPDQETPIPDPAVEAVLNRAAPRVLQRAAREQAPPYVPGVGWPLAILCWIAMLGWGIVLLLVILSAVGLQVIHNAESKNIAVPLLIVLGTLPAANFVALLGILRYQRWGIFVFLVFSIGPMILQMILGMPFPPWEIMLAVFNIVVFLLSMGKWHEFE
jgi:hypothetical protein